MLKILHNKIIGNYAYLYLDYVRTLKYYQTILEVPVVVASIVDCG